MSVSLSQSENVFPVIHQIAQIGCNVKIYIFSSKFNEYED